MILLDHLAKLFPTAKRTTLRRMIQAGRVRVNGLRAQSSRQTLAQNAQVEVIDSLPRASASRELPRLAFDIVYEDADLIVINKPPGLLTSTGPREKRPTVLAGVRQYLRDKDSRAQVGLIHRLDRDASGLIVFSKNHEAYLSLKRQFFSHSVTRIYLALVHGSPTPRCGTIDSRLIERADGSVHSTTSPATGERAITHYETIQSQKKRSLVRVRLQTGKKHQIRVHLSERGVPIVNDPIYAREKPLGRLMLAAVELSIDHPRTKKRMTFRIEPPVEMRT